MCAPYKARQHPLDGRLRGSDLLRTHANLPFDLLPVLPRQVHRASWRIRCQSPGNLALAIGNDAFRPFEPIGMPAANDGKGAE